MVFVVYIDTGSLVLCIPSRNYSAISFFYYWKGSENGRVFTIDAFHQNHVIWRTKITQFWRNGNDSKQPYWKSIKKTTCFCFLVQYTRKCINFNHLSNKPIKLCGIYSKWKKINIRNQSQRSRHDIKEKVALWPLKQNRTMA